LISAGSQVRVLSGPDSQEQKIFNGGERPKSPNQNCSDTKRSEEFFDICIQGRKYNFKNKKMKLSL
jgi:hypothetical protein